ncbi:hypothetical protein [Hymenobacter terrenus]|uniref:hypothetical protein n=1 Tax=Hymenobacter terrenus TaxID=1629124 RepID=UPI000619E239|nr:hypothetical protein [Hymenobacter terrenus]
MKPEILQQIVRLGGNITEATGSSLQDNLQAITFQNPLYPRSYQDSLYGIDEFYQKHKDQYFSSKSSFYSSLLAHFFYDHTIPYGQDFFRSYLFTPFTENTESYGELDGIATPEEIKQLIKCNSLEFICICHSYGFPDHYFICLTDENQDNPTVYSTDHEFFFQDITIKGSLEDFFGNYLEKSEFLKIVQQHIESQNLH